MSSAGISQKKRKAAVRKESAETQESCQQNDTEVDRDEGMEELSFVPSAVSDTAGFKFFGSQPFWWKMTEDRTRSTSVRLATTGG